jgi:hypothetical protein
MQAIIRRPATPSRPARARHLFSAIAVAVGLGSIASVAQAQTPSNACGQASTILENAYPGARPAPDQRSYVLGDRLLMLPQGASDDIPAMVCKVWPAQDKLLLVAVPRMDSKASLETDRVGDLDILVVDRNSLKVQQRLTLPDAMSDDAIQIQKLEFDTARYVIAPDVQAFGLRTTRNGASRANPFNEVSLTLFARTGSAGDGKPGPLRVVLDKLSVERASGEWDTNCTGDFTQRKSVLAMSGEKHEGFYDIRVSQSSERSKAALTGKNQTDCKETAEKAVKTQETLRYDGKQYVIPANAKSL